MAHRHIYNTSPTFEAEPDQHWNHLSTEDQYLHFARTGGSENGPTFNPAENASVDRPHYASHWSAGGRSSGYPFSSQMVNAPHFQPETSEPPRDSLHASAPGNGFMVPENHVHHASSSNYGVDSNLFDNSMGNQRPYKRKSPAVPVVNERGSTSRYYGAGSSSDVSSSTELWNDKSTDAQRSHWDSFAVPPSYRGNQLSIGGQSSMRNVRSRSALDLESDVFRSHVPANYSHRPSSNRFPVDQPGSVDHPGQNLSVPLPEWNPIHVSSAPHVRPLVSNSLTHDNNHFFAGSSVANGSGEMAGYHHDHISNRNSVNPQSLHAAPLHTRGVRSSYTHRSGSNNRVSMGNLRIGHGPPPDEGLQVAGESHSSRHARPFVGWRNGDRSSRSRLSYERHRLLAEDAGIHDWLTAEGFTIVDHSSLYGSRSFLDQHREMRLDVDNMSYEELLALGERIGSVSTGVREDQLPKCFTESVYCSSDHEQEEGRCVICLEEYKHMDDVGTLKACGHDYHVGCIKKWLSMKNACPICKGPALPEKLKDK